MMGKANTLRATGTASSQCLIYLGRRGRRPYRAAALRLLTIALLCGSAHAAVHYVNVASTNPVPPFIDWSTAATNIQDAIDLANSGDQVLVTNGVYSTGGRPFNGNLTNLVVVDKPLTVASINGPAATIIDGYPTVTVRCVYLADGATLAGFCISNGTAPYAAMMPQDTYGAGVLCESTNSVITNCVLTGNVAGFGGGAYLGTLYHCVLTNNYAQQSGGGAYQSALTSCVLVANGATSGGAAYRSTLDSCLLTNNSAHSGGGASSSVLNSCLIVSNGSSGVATCTLNNCTVVGNFAGTGHGAVGRGGGAINSALNNCTIVANGVYNVLVGTPGGSGGGASSCVMNNCIIYYNTAASSPNYDGINTMNYCCTTPLFGSGIGNISAQPRLVNQTQLDVHLQSNSPCINAGRNLYVSDPTDLDGNPRIAGGTVDIGAYEFPNPTSIISYAWLQQYGLPIDGSADQVDTDSDGMNNWQEWICGTNPTNAASLLQLLPLLVDPLQVTVTWQSVTNRSYFLERSSDLSAQPAFQTIAIKISGQLGTTTFIDTTATSPGPLFYRVGVEQ